MNRSVRVPVIAVLVALCALPGLAKKKKEEPFSVLNFVVIRDDGGKPVRNAAVVLHPVREDGKQSRGGLELKTNPDGKASYEGVPYGKLRIQVLASGFQTYGEDYDINQPEMEITIKMKRPAKQYSIYEDHAGDKTGDKKDEPKPQGN